MPNCFSSVNSRIGRRSNNLGIYKMIEFITAKIVWKKNLLNRAVFHTRFELKYSTMYIITKTTTKKIVRIFGNASIMFPL